MCNRLQIGNKFMSNHYSNTNILNNNVNTGPITDRISFNPNINNQFNKKSTTTNTEQVTIRSWINICFNRD